jgi:hypothetical protein
LKHDRTGDKGRGQTKHHEGAGHVALAVSPAYSQNASSKPKRIAPDKVAEARARHSSKEIAALPKRINGNLKRNAELLKQAKGLK